MRDDLRLMRLWLGLGLVQVAVVWYLSLGPAPPLAQLSVSDKDGHALAYGVQTLWFCWLVWRPQQRWVALWFLLQGLLLELLQGADPQRSPELADALANTIGVAVGWVAGRWSGGILPAVERRLQRVVTASGVDS